MTTPIGSVSASTPPTATSSADKPAATANDNLGEDAFLKLLVAQLKYQNPMNPTDSTQFIAQTAQFTMVEKLTELTKSVTENATLERLTGAASLIGRHATYLDADGKAQTALVDGIDMSNGTPSLAIGDAHVALGSVLSLQEK